VPATVAPVGRRWRVERLAQRLAIIGVGLIGGSLARAVRDACAEVVGCGRNEARLQRAVELGVIDRYELDVGDAVHGADLVVVAVPLGAMGQVFHAMRDRLGPHTVVTDAGSAKAYVIDAARKGFGGIPPRFVPGHPIAGNDKTGVEASSAGLFRRHRVVLTPLPETDPEAVSRVRALWASTGAEVVEMDPVEHDESLAATSHLPHVIAYALMDTLMNMDPRGDLLRYAAGGLGDMTRIAGSDPDLWRDICLANRAALLRVLQRFRTELAAIEEALAASDAGRLRSAFALGCTGRRELARILPQARAAGPREPE
jgi:prephenate dehydrogenase